MSPPQDSPSNNLRNEDSLHNVCNAWSLDTLASGRDTFGEFDPSRSFCEKQFQPGRLHRTLSAHGNHPMEASHRWTYPSRGPRVSSLDCSPPPHLLPRTQGISSIESRIEDGRRAQISAGPRHGVGPPAAPPRKQRPRESAKELG